MHTQNYFIAASSNISGGGTQPIKLGYPEQIEMINDICICKSGSGDFLPLNSLILRSALLNSAGFIKRHLKLEIKPVEPEVQQEEKPKAKNKKEA